MVKQFFLVTLDTSSDNQNYFRELLTNLSSEQNISFIISQPQPSFLSSIDGNDLSFLINFNNYNLVQLETSIPIEANTIYFLPDNEKCVLKDGVLKRLNGEDAIALPFNFPYDILLDSLAQEQATNTFAIKLSSQTEDGKRGIQILKSAGGIIFDPSQPPQQVATEIKQIIAKKRSHSAQVSLSKPFDPNHKISLKYQENILRDTYNILIATDLNGTIIYWNYRAEEVYGVN